jgi:predicted phosphoribosyltransferase
MNADCRGALAQLNKSYKAFEHKGKKMSKAEVKAVLQYAVDKGYEHTGMLSDEEVDSILEQHKSNNNE